MVDTTQRSALRSSHTFQNFSNLPFTGLAWFWGVNLEPVCQYVFRVLHQSHLESFASAFALVRGLLALLVSIDLCSCPRAYENAYDLAFWAD